MVHSCYNCQGRAQFQPISSIIPHAVLLKDSVWRIIRLLFLPATATAATVLVSRADRGLARLARFWIYPLKGIKLVNYSISSLEYQHFVQHDVMTEFCCAVNWVGAKVWHCFWHFYSYDMYGSFRKGDASYKLVSISTTPSWKHAPNPPYICESIQPVDHGIYNKKTSCTCIQ